MKSKVLNPKIEAPMQAFSNAVRCVNKFAYEEALAQI